MDPAQFGRKDRYRAQQQQRVKIGNRTGEREHRDPEQTDCRRSGETPECLRPSGISEFVDNFCGEAVNDYGYGKNRSRRRQRPRKRRDVVADKFSVGYENSSRVRQYPTPTSFLQRSRHAHWTAVTVCLDGDKIVSRAQ
jgi:hypothetical protein